MSDEVTAAAGVQPRATNISPFCAEEIQGDFGTAAGFAQSPAQCVAVPHFHGGIVRIRQNLAIIADVATILGVSIVGFIGTPLVSVLLGREFNLFSLVNGVFFYFVVTGMTVLISIGLLRRSWRLLQEKKYFRLVFSLFVYLLSLSIVVGILRPSRDLWANLLGNEYLFPPSPSEVVEGLALRYRGEDASIVGKVTWKPGHLVEIQNYRAVAYLKYSDESPFYKVHEFFTPIHGGSSVTELVRISADGSFVVPNITTNLRTLGNVLQGSIVAIVARLDGEPLRRRYPPGVTDKNATLLREIRAFAETCEIGNAQQPRQPDAR